MGAGDQGHGTRLLVRGVVLQDALPRTARGSADDALFAHDAFDGLVWETVSVDGRSIGVDALARTLRAEERARMA